MLLYLAVTVY